NKFIDDAKYMIRPTKYTSNNHGKGLVFINLNVMEVAIINLQGTTFLPAIDNPFDKIDELIEEAKRRTDIIFVDFHGEATSEKQAMGWYTARRVSEVVGTNKNTQAADKRIRNG